MMDGGRGKSRLLYCIPINNLSLLDSITIVIETVGIPVGIIFQTFYVIFSSVLLGLRNLCTLMLSLVMENDP